MIVSEEPHLRILEVPPPLMDTSRGYVPISTFHIEASRSADTPSILNAARAKRRVILSRRRTSLSPKNVMDFSCKLPFLVLV